MKQPSPQTIASIARYIAALHQDAQAHITLANALQPFHDILVQLAAASATTTPAYKQLQYEMADLVTDIIDANHVVTTTNDELRHATLAYAIAMENNSPTPTPPAHRN